MKKKFTIEELLTCEAIDRIVHLELDRVVKMLGKSGYAVNEAQRPEHNPHRHPEEQLARCTASVWQSQRQDDKKVREAAKLLRSWYSDEGLV